MLRMGYAVKGKLYGELWESPIFEDAADCDEVYHDIIEDKDYSELKRCNVYIHYEEWA